MNDLYLVHHGVKGMKWGVRKDRYKSRGLVSYISRKQNEKVDKSFKKWNTGSQNRENAINLGLERNKAKIAYEKSNNDKNLRNVYKQSNRAYKSALRKNTTYRKGQVKSEVGKDLSRKYLSDAKKVKKQLDSDPSNKSLKKQYNDLMSKHDIERAKARRAPIVAQNRSNKKASIKRGMTMTIKTAATTAAIGAGVAVANKYLSGTQATLNGSPLRFNAQSVQNAIRTGRKIMSYV